MLGTIEMLRDISDRCLEGRPLSCAQREWLGQVLGRFLTHENHTIEDAMGLRFPRGGVPWWREESIRKRDAALRELAARHFPTLSVTAKARMLRRLTVRYAASAWRFDSVDTEMPPHYQRTVQEWLWRAFSTGAPLPIGERHLRHILSGVITSLPGKAETSADVTEELAAASTSTR